MEINITAYIVLCFTSFFTLTNPLGTMPVFLNQTEGCTDEERKKIAAKATITGFIILATFAICGRFIFQVFGLSTDGFRIVGGIIIFKIGYDMLQAHFTHIKLNEKERQLTHYANNIAITPLAIPMLCGPGAIAQGIVLMDDAPNLLYKGILIATMGLVFLLAFIILRAAPRIFKLLGETGNNVMMRLMGLILMVIGVECLFNGLTPILRNIFG